MEAFGNFRIELLAAFFLAFVSTIASQIALNYYHKHDIGPCAENGAVQGLVLGLMACISWFVAKLLLGS